MNPGMIWFWISVAFVAGFGLAVCLAREVHKQQSREIVRLRKKLFETTRVLNEANRLIASQNAGPDWWRDLG